MRVLVTDGNNRAALAITRSLGRAGHEVMVGECREPALAQTSRFCRARVGYPDPSLSADAWVDAVVQAVREQRIDVLIPVSDITTLLVTGHRSRFPVECAIPFADYATVDRAANKVDLMETARALGVPVPRSVVVTSPSDVPAGLEFPVVVKPWRSRVRVGSGWESTAVSHAADAEELERDLSARQGYEFPVMLQERIVGPGMGVFAIYDRGRPIAFFSHRRLREKPPWGGVSVLSESAPLPPDATAAATRLLNALQWHGVAMVEFKRDVRDGVPKLMEINGRFWGSLQLAIDAGVDFPALLVDGVKGRMTPPAPYEVGVRSRWWWGDVDALLLTLAGRGPHGASSLKDRLRALGPFLFPLGRRLYYENPRWQDLGPGIFESYRWLSAIARPRLRPRAAARPPVGVAKRAAIER